MEARQEQGLIAREQRFRARLLSVLSAAFVTIAALLLFLLVPFFPTQISVFIAIVLGVVAFKAPSLALVIMLVLAIPGYIYQLGPPPDTNTGLPLLVVIGMAVLLFIPAASAAQPGAVLGIATGIIAAMLMLTPLHFLALPMMVAIPLFRARGGKVGSTGAIVVFMALYFPILAAQQHVTQPTQVVPLFQHLALDAKPAISVIDVGNVFSRLADGVLLPGSGADKQFLANLTVYWPVQVGGRVPPLGIVLAIAFALSIASAFAAVAFFRWLERWETADGRLHRASPALSLLVADIAFLLPLGILSGPLAYTVNVNSVGLIFSTICVGAVGGTVEYWLRKRDRMVRLREELGETLPALRERLEALSARIAETRPACPRIDLPAEEGLVEKCRQELSFAAGTIDEMSTEDLSEKLALVQDLDRRLSQALEESFRKLWLYYDEDKRRYNEIVRSAAEFGISPGDPVAGPVFSQLDSLGYEVVLDLQRQLKNSYREAARPMANAVGELEKTIRSEVDPNFRRVGIEIARNYMMQEQYDEALETFLAELSGIERLVGGMVKGLDARLVNTARNLRSIVPDSLIPMATMMGDSEDAGHYGSLLGQLDGLVSLKPEQKRLPDLMEMVLKVKVLGDTTTAVVTRLSERIRALEGLIEAKVPSGYNWGKNPRIAIQVENALNGLKAPTVTADIEGRMSLIGIGLKTMDDEVSAIKQYTSVHEFLINYANIEYLVDEKLETAGSVSYADLPVKPTYAQQYLRLFSQTHPRRVFLEERTGAVKLRSPA